MDVSNQHLKELLEKTDNAFKALMQAPDSTELNQAYDRAKLDLDSYVSSLRHTLNQRRSQR
ncbi:hypothetical protein [Alteromonas halophila]|uniref:Uncharacterized protein n=1 Tax=Alteromonas halophila TaxID=516698 RepID=A0A918N095_9ALTE|nr:hypothetical protein [Alteromonas halophila]GGW92981.1 hypothetical protein GCM10007391_29050 [Alteromonas halophila]